MCSGICNVKTLAVHKAQTDRVSKTKVKISACKPIGTDAYPPVSDNSWAGSRQTSVLHNKLWLA